MPTVQSLIQRRQKTLENTKGKRTCEKQTQPLVIGEPALEIGVLRRGISVNAMQQMLHGIRLYDRIPIGQGHFIIENIIGNVRPAACKAGMHVYSNEAVKVGNCEDNNCNDDYNYDHDDDYYLLCCCSYNHYYNGNGNIDDRNYCGCDDHDGDHNDDDDHNNNCSDDDDDDDDEDDMMTCIKRRR